MLEEDWYVADMYIMSFRFCCKIVKILSYKELLNAAIFFATSISAYGYRFYINRKYQVILREIENREINHDHHEMI